MPLTSALLISELDAIDGWSPERWAITLRQVTKLFLERAGSLATNQVTLFDDVLVRLADRVDTPTLAQLSHQLSDIKCTLPLCNRRLALYGDETVSLPILRSLRLTPELLLEVVRSGSAKHRVAIALRHSVDPAVSEALVQFADSAINHALAENFGAKLLEADWARLVQIAETDPRLAQKLARRSDMPEPLRRKIRAKIEDSRMRHLNAMPAVMREQIENSIAAADTTKMLTGAEPEFAAAKAAVIELGRKGKLNDQTINRFAVRGEYVNIVVALSFLTGSPAEVIQPLLAADNIEALVLACKASRLDWATAVAIVKHRPGQSPVPAAELDRARKTFDEFSLSAAQRTVRF